jgi:hypothetical protein
VTTAEREHAIALLSEGFAQGELELEVFEERVTAAHRAQAPDELAALTADLSAALAAAPVIRAVAVADGAPAVDSAVAIFGGTRRRGGWNVPRQLRVTAFFGGVELDLREARLPPSPVDVEVKAVLGGVQIIVPPNLAVEVHGSAILGGFEQLDRTPAAPEPDVPVVRIHGTAVLGGVSVETRLPGESSRSAHRRRHRARRAARHAR